MQLNVTYSLHEPSTSLNESIKAELNAIRELLRVDEARVHVEHLPDQSPAFRMRAHLVTPGPDVMAEARDHTLRAALHKLMAKIEGAIDHRRKKQAQRR